jgi:hypothetical protein
MLAQNLRIFPNVHFAHKYANINAGIYANDNPTESRIRTG